MPRWLNATPNCSPRTTIDCWVTGHHRRAAARDARRCYIRATYYAYAFQAIPEPADTLLGIHGLLSGNHGTRIAEQAARLAIDRTAAKELCEPLGHYWQIHWQRHPEHEVANALDRC